VIEAAAIVATVALAFLLRGQALPMGLAAASAALLVASLAAFFSLTFPGNVATNNWTSVRQNWESLRLNWEIGHASGAVLTFLSLFALSAAVVSSRSS
jgi:hypothetical protein